MENIKPSKMEVNILTALQEAIEEILESSDSLSIKVGPYAWRKELSLVFLDKLREHGRSKLTQYVVGPYGRVKRRNPLEFHKKLDMQAKATPRKSGVTIHRGRHNVT